VDVLQAVHLLLSFKLFVVLVAVDVRWVSKALQEQYPMLRETGSNMSVPHDYLEKIFQIPYWVRPMDAVNSAAFVGDRLVRIQSKNAEPSSRSGNISLFERTRSTDAGSDSTSIRSVAASRSFQSDIGQPAVIEPSGDGGKLVLPDADEPLRPRTSSLAQVPTDGIMLSKQLGLTDQEGDLLKELAWSAGASPRRVLRFLNVYQVVKASLSNDQAVNLELDGYETLMSQVAIVTGSPGCADQWQYFLASLEPTSFGSSLNSAVDERFSAVAEPGAERLRSATSILMRHRPTTSAREILASFVLARRFSFNG
jgi:hypothetical protein